MKTNFKPVINVEDDGLFIQDVGTWVEKKLTLFGHYCNIFTNSMRKKWDCLVYMDLFSCSGYNKIRNTNKIIKGSPLIALSLPTPFDKYIFCEKEEVHYLALKERLERDFQNHYNNIKILNGDCNEIIDQLIEAIPKPNKNYTVLGFCFIDPYSLDIHFKTIQKLSERYVDFLIHISDMDAKLNRHNYLKDKSNRIELFLDNLNWRNFYSHNDNFVLFLFDEFSKKMIKLNYLEPENMSQIRSDQKNLGLYHLAFYSRNERGVEFWKKIHNISIPQLF